MENYLAVRRALERFQVRILAIADASLRHKIENPALLERLIDDGSIIQSPAATTADAFLWKMWKRLAKDGQRAFIVTNDRFPITLAQAEGVAIPPRIAFMVIDGEAEFEPSLESLFVAEASQVHIFQSITSEPSSFDGPGPVPVSTSRTGAISDSTLDLVAAVIAARTNPPGGPSRKVPFTVLGEDLRRRTGKDLKSATGYRRLKELADELVRGGWAQVSSEGPAHFLEPSSALEERISAQGHSRLITQGAAGVTRKAEGERSRQISSHEAARALRPTSPLGEEDPHTTREKDAEPGHPVCKCGFRFTRRFPPTPETVLAEATEKYDHIRTVHTAETVSTLEKYLSDRAADYQRKRDRATKLMRRLGDENAIFKLKALELRRRVDELASLRDETNARVAELKSARQSASIPHEQDRLHQEMLRSAHNAQTIQIRLTEAKVALQRNGAKISELNAQALEAKRKSDIYHLLAAAFVDRVMTLHPRE